jgi:hypothetical protein
LPAKSLSAAFREFRSVAVTNQSVLFSEDIYDALGDVVRALGGTKAVGAMMRPEKPADEAGKWVKDCLNRQRAERFDPEQVLWLLRKGREVGCHSAIAYICDEAGYSRPTPTEPEDERAALQRAYIESVKHARLIADRMERLNGLKAVA